MDTEVSPEQLVPSIHLPGGARSAVDRYESASKRLERDQQAARSAAAMAIEALVGDLSFSVRDAGVVLGLSHQRVHQLVSTADVSEPAASLTSP